MSEENWGAATPSGYSRYPTETPTDYTDTSEMYWSTIDQHYPLVMRDEPDTVREAASSWFAIYSAYSGLADDVRTEGNTLKTQWKSPTAQQEFLSKLGMLTATLDSWANQALENWRAMRSLSSAIATAQTNMEALWRDFDTEYKAKQEQDQTGFWGALNPAEIVRDVGDQILGERTSEVVSRFSNRSRTDVLDPLNDAYTAAWLGIDGAAVYTGPKDAIAPDLDAMQRALAGRIPGPGAPGAPTAPGGVAPVSPNAARAGAFGSPKNPGAPPVAPQTAHLAGMEQTPAPVAPPMAPMAPAGAGLFRPTAPNAPAAATGPAAPPVAPTSSGATTPSGAMAPTAPAVPPSLAGMTARGLAPAAPSMGSAAAPGRGPAPMAPNAGSPGSPVSPGSPGSSGPAAGAPAAPGAGRPGTPTMPSPGAGGRPGSGGPGAPALPGRNTPQAPKAPGAGPAPSLPGRGSGARPASAGNGPGGGAGVPPALRGRAGDGPRPGSPAAPGAPGAPGSGRSVPRSLQGRAFGGPAGRGAAGPGGGVPQLPQALRGRGAGGSGTTPGNVEAARRALRSSVSGRPVTSGGTPAGLGARTGQGSHAGQGSRTGLGAASARGPSRKDEPGRSFGMVGDHELFDTEQPRPDVLRAKESTGPVKKAGPAIGTS